MPIPSEGKPYSDLVSSAWSQCPSSEAGKGGVFKGRALKDAIDILVMSRADPLVFTYSSGFGAMAGAGRQCGATSCHVSQRGFTCVG